jgi:hypothetical protein
VALARLPPASRTRWLFYIVSCFRHLCKRAFTSCPWGRGGGVRIERRGMAGTFRTPLIFLERPALHRGLFYVERVGHAFRERMASATDAEGVGGAALPANFTLYPSKLLITLALAATRKIAVAETKPMACKGWSFPLFKNHIVCRVASRRELMRCTTTTPKANSSSQECTRNAEAMKTPFAPR